MFKRQRTGSVLCTSCGKLVGVQDETCWNCGRRNPGLWGFAPFLRRVGNDLGFGSIVLWGCSALYIASLLVDPSGIRMGGTMSLLSPSTRALFIFGASGAIPVFGYGRWWTVLSAAWLHGGILHILFNMMWVRQLAPDVAELYGGSRLAIIYTLSSMTGFFLSSWAGTFVGLPAILRGASFTIGASAPIFGLLGALVAYGRRGGSSHISNQAMTYAVIIFVFGFIMPGIDNFAHLGGFLGGYAAGLLLDPLRPEGLNHLIVALSCIALTALSVLASFLQGALL
ncbi:MAG TPA: rhomboid family intramembrane serine protease [Acidobacteriota bacterium]|nr:rhomboid family intramembrane serine protease [Acidobacteriota bacterium]